MIATGQKVCWVLMAMAALILLWVLNTGDTRYSTHPFHLCLSGMGVNGPLKAKDLWSGKEVELTEGMPLELKTHDVLLLRMAAAK